MDTPVKLPYLNGEKPSSREYLRITEYVVIYFECGLNDTPHWCIHTVDDDGDQLIFEALGSTGQAFHYQSRSVNMDKSKSEKQEIHIGRIEADVWSEIPSLFSGVPVSTQAGWSCQNWVMQAIEALKKMFYLEEDNSGLESVQVKY